MKAARFTGPDMIEIAEVPSPECGRDEIILEVQRAGICGTDLRIFRGRKEVAPPVTLGHEFSGTIVETGSDVTGLSNGMRVTVEPIIPCGTCYCCRTERENICLTRPTIGYQYDGGFAEYVRIPAKAIEMGNVIPIPEDLDFDLACYAEPLAACINGAKKLSIREGERVWVIGDGPIGLTHLQLASFHGAEQVFLSGTRDDRLSVGDEFGAAGTLNVTSSDDPVQWAEEKSGGDGMDVAILAANAPGAVSEAIASLRKGGRLLLFAGYPPGTELPFDLAAIHYGEYQVLGSSGHSARDMRKAVELMSDGQFNARPLITHHFPVESICAGLEMKENFVGLKHVIDLR